MAVAWFNALCQNGYQAFSCGTMPADRIDPMAVKVMREVGLSIRHHSPQSVNQQAVSNADLIVIMGSDIFPKAFSPQYIWKLKDPVGQPIEQYRQLRDAIRVQVQALIEEIEQRNVQSQSLDSKTVCPV